MSDKTSIQFSQIKEIEATPTNLVRVVLIIAALVVPFVVQDFRVALVAEIFFLAMFAMSLDLLMGYTGYVSFGHAAFFGTAAYTTGLVLRHVTDLTVIAMLAGVAAAALVAVPIGYFSLKRFGIYFAMLTLAFSQLLYVLVVNNVFDLTGGSDGLSGLARGNFGIPGVFDFQPTTVGYYYLILFALVGIYLAMQRIVNSPFGAVMVAIRENETRAEYAGYDVDRYKLGSFVISAAFGGVAGALYMPYYKVLTPELFFWAFSGEAIVMVLIGGMGTLIGPVLGAALYVILRELVSPYLADWTMVLGFVFIVFILFLPNGLISTWDVARDRLKALLGDRKP